MRKRLFAAAAAIIFAAAPLVSCGNTEADEPSASVSSSDSESVSEEENSDNKNNDKENDSIIGETDAYTVYNDYLAENIGYPQIRDMKDEALQDEINELLRSIESSRYDRYAEMQEEPNYVSYAEVKYCDDDYLTVIQMAFFDDGTIETGGYSMTNINLNMKTGEELELNEFITDIDAAAEKFYNNDGIVIIDGYEGASMSSFIEEHYIESVSDMAEYISTASFSLTEGKKPAVRFPSSEGGFWAYIE